VNEFEPLAVDRELRKCAVRWRSFRRALAAGETELANPFVLSRAVCGRNAFLELGQLTHDPVAPALRRWVYRFTEQRVNLGTMVAIAEQRNQERYPLEAPEKVWLTLDAMLKRGLRVSETRRDWFQAFLQRTEATHALVVNLWERRQELAVRMQLPSPDAVEAPCDGLYEVAEQWLVATDDAWESAAELGLDQLVEQALAHTASVDWPAHLNPRTLLGFFADTQLFKDLELDPGDLPDAIAPASYLRALARLGSAFLDAAAPRDQPFAIAHDAYGLERRCHGALFAMLPAHPAFLRRRLGASTSSVPAAKRALAVSILIETRLAALRVLLRRAAHAGGRAFRDAFQEQGLTACRVLLPANSAGVIIRLHDDDLQRFAACFLGASRFQELLEAHDVDWFRNPRAVDQLRSEAALPPRTSCESTQLQSGVLALRHWLTEAIA
jgi:hypothetical protein